MAFQFIAEQWVPYPLNLVFAFFANPENLPRLMPRWQSVRIEEAMFAPPPPRPAGVRAFPGIVAGSGSRLTLSARPVPFSPLRAPWEALIQDFRWNQGFCDVQLRGPFRSWKHCHSVHERVAHDGRPGTLIRDEVKYELPLGRLSVFADKLAAKNGLAYAFTYRHKRTLELLARMAAQTGTPPRLA